MKYRIATTIIEFETVKALLSTSKLSDTITQQHTYGSTYKLNRTTALINLEVNLQKIKITGDTHMHDSVSTHTHNPR